MLLKYSVCNGQSAVREWGEGEGDREGVAQKLSGYIFGLYVNDEDNNFSSYLKSCMNAKVYINYMYNERVTRVFVNFGYFVYFCDVLYASRAGHSLKFRMHVEIQLQRYLFGMELRLDGSTTD